MTDEKCISKRSAFSQDFLFQVFIDVNCGSSSLQDWQANNDPTILQVALNDAAECRRMGFPTKIIPFGAL